MNADTSPWGSGSPAGPQPVSVGSIPVGDTPDRTERATGQTGITCGLDDCRRNLWRTMKPAASLWCPEHGHVIDAQPSPPLQGIAFLSLANRGGGCTTVELEQEAKGHSGCTTLPLDAHDLDDDTFEKLGLR